MKITKVIGIFAKRIIISKRFFMATILLTVLLILDLLPTFVSGISEHEGKIYFSYDVLSLFMLHGFTFLMGFSLIAAVIPGGGIYCDDNNSRFIVPILQRINSLEYAVGVVAATFVGTFAGTFISYCLCLLFYRFFLPLSNGQNGLGTYSLVAEEKNLMFVGALITVYALRGVFFALITLVLSTFIKNKYIVFSTPFLLFYFLMIFGYGILKMPTYLNVRGIYFGFVHGMEHEIRSVAYAFFVTVIVAVLATCVLNRRLRSIPVIQK